MGRKVLFAQDMAEDGKNLLREKGFEVVMAPSEDRAVIKELIADAEAVFSKTLFLDEDILSAGKKLQVVAKHGVGIDNVVDLATATKLGLYVVNTPQANSLSVAEHVIAGMLGFSVKMVQMHDAAVAADFAKQDTPDKHEISGKTLGIIGLGNIGRRVAKIAALGFDMKIIGYDPFVNPASLPDYIEVTNDINRIYREGDFVTLHLGANPSTIGMVGKEQFAMMKPTCVFVNMARGALVKEDEFAEALKNHVIKGAVIDVFAQEPVSADNPLLKLDNVLLSPHSAALTEEALANMSRDGALGIAQILSGEKPTWCLNYDKVNEVRAGK